MIILSIIVSLIITIISIIWIVIIHLKKTERQKYYAAAGNILREEFLDFALQNTISPESNIQQPKNTKMMLYIKTGSHGKVNQFVFDPEKIITFGRDSRQCDIFINDMEVSQNHCQIYSNGYKVYLADLNSANGTIIKRGFFKKYIINKGYQIELKTNDKIIIGSALFKVCLFYFDLSIM